MRQSKTTLMILTHRYRDILRKCAILNATVLLGAVVALPASAEVIMDYVTYGTAFSAEGQSAERGGVFEFRNGATFEETATFTNNSTTGTAPNYGFGGALFIDYTSPNAVVFEGTASFVGNHANAGGAVFNEAELQFNSSVTFDGNYATEVGALANIGTLKFKDAVVFTGNHASSTVGALSNGGAGTITFEELATFSGNYAETNQGSSFGNSGIMTFKNGLIIDSNGVDPNGYQTTGAGNSGTLNITGGDLTVTNNKANRYSGFYNSAGTFNVSGVGTINFANNEAIGSSAGALGLHENSESVSLAANSITFDNNKSTGDGYGGAIFAAADLSILGTNNTFSNNKSITTGYGSKDETYYGGGAIHARSVGGDDTVTIGTSDSTNTFYKNTSNEQGGAIFARNAANVVLNGTTTFEQNTAAKNGGAVYVRDAESTITFNGNTIFSKNTANGVANDIYSNGTVNFNGDVTLDGGISGNGTVTFADGTTLSATLQTTLIQASSVEFAGNNTLNLTVANGLANADYDFISAGTLTGVDNVTIADNAIYNLVLTDAGKLNVSVKSSKEIIENIDVPVTTQEAETLSVIISSNGNGTEVANAIADAISEAMQSGDSAAAVQAVQELAPTTSQQVMGVAQGVNNMLSNVTGGRMAAVSGRAGGDAFIGGSMWAQTLYNYTKQHTTSNGAGFEANSTGVAMGIDGKANDALTLGFGYGYTHTGAKPDGRKVNVGGHTFFVYGSYQPDVLYVDAMLSYGVSSYTEKKAPMGIAMEAKYHVNTFAANIMSGYGFENGLTPEGGLRYVSASQESYNDGAQNISSDNNDVLTAVMGVKYEAGKEETDWRFKTKTRLAVTYDLVSDNSRATIDVIGGGNYQIVGKRLHRLGGEAGIGVTGTHGKWDFSLEYNVGFRRDYQSHTGLLKAQYNF